MADQTSGEQQEFGQDRKGSAVGEVFEVGHYQQ